MTDWANAGGPNECKHGFSAGIPCDKCGPHKVEYDLLDITGEYLKDYRDGEALPYDPIYFLGQMRVQAVFGINDCHREGRKSWCRHLVAIDVGLDAANLVRSDEHQLSYAKAAAWDALQKWHNTFGDIHPHPSLLAEANRTSAIVKHLEQAFEAKKMEAQFRANAGAKLVESEASLKRADELLTVYENVKP